MFNVCGESVAQGYMRASAHTVPRVTTCLAQRTHSQLVPRSVVAVTITSQWSSASKKIGMQICVETESEIKNILAT